ncbi:MAG TPA: hypothetical protein ENK02_04550 [Planctomycetes bacterium]|nr:hypothetical protein [Planctomycetota bacterium]
MHIRVHLGGKHGESLLTNSDPQGRFRLPLDFVGPLFLFASHPDFAPQKKPLFLDRKDPNSWLRVPKITLLSGRRLAFQFRNPGGNPLAGVRAFLQEKLGTDRGPFQDPPKEATSDPSGRVQFLGLPPDSKDSEFQLQILPPPPYIPTLLKSWPPSQGGTPIPVTLLEGLSLRGRVEDSFGRPSPKAQVRLLPLGSSSPPPPSKAQIQSEGRRPPSRTSPTERSPLPSQVRCDAQGRFFLQGLPRGPCQILAHPHSLPPRVWIKQRIELPFQGSLLLRLPKGGRLELRLPAHLPFTSFGFLRSTDGRNWRETNGDIPIPSHPPSSLTRDQLPRETLRLRLHNPQGFHFTTHNLDFEARERIPLDLSPLLGARLKGRIRGVAKPRKGGALQIRLLSTDPKIQALGRIERNICRIEIQEDGSFQLGPVPAGRYELRWGSHTLGSVQLAPGGTIEKSFSLP